MACQRCGHVVAETPEAGPTELEELCIMPKTDVLLAELADKVALAQSDRLIDAFV